MAVVDPEELAEICEVKDIKTYMAKWKNLLGQLSQWGTKLLVGAILEENYVGGKKFEDIILSAKYIDFVDMFNKQYADFLLLYSQHNLAIDIEKNKILLFGPTYDHSRNELEMLCKYINNMLAKRFIVLSKSPSEASVSFTKKKDRRLCLYIDFCGLNAITTKNKHLFLLICTLIDLFADAKHYTKLDIIATYNVLHVHKSDK